MHLLNIAAPSTRGQCVNLGSHRLGTTSQTNKTKGKKVDQGPVGRWSYRLTGSSLGKRLCMMGLLLGMSVPLEKRRFMGSQTFSIILGPEWSELFAST